MLHYFNPGHETAVLNDSKYYHPPARQIKMQQDLAYLPAWYADPKDYVLVRETLPAHFLESITALQPLARAVTEDGLAAVPTSQTVDLWGISPDSVYYFEQLRQRYQLSNLCLPLWKADYRKLGSRETGANALAFLTDKLNDIDSTLRALRVDSIDKLSALAESSPYPLLVKSPYSSSGRGLVWLPAKSLERSERQIISGMLKRQEYVTAERTLDKTLDFSMHFRIERKTCSFMGYSIFETNNKGAYQRSLLLNQNKLHQRIAQQIGNAPLLEEVKQLLITFIEETFGEIYEGAIGVDMLTYRNGNEIRLHPCVEINMRKSMGYLAIELQGRHLINEIQGSYHVDYFKQAGEALTFHQRMQQAHPLRTVDKKISSGYLSLCPVTEASNYMAYLFVD